MKEEIENVLKSMNEATSKQIATKLGNDPVEVARELNRMRADGLVEREKKAGGNEYSWWLVARTMGSPPNNLDLAPYTPALTLSEVLRNMGAEALVETVSQVEGPFAEAPVTSGKPEAVDAPEFCEVDAPLSSLCSFLEIDILKTDTPVADAIEVMRLRAQAIADLQTYTLTLQSANEKLRTNNAVLERSIDELTIVDAEFVPHPLFVTVGRYSPPKRHSTLEKAQRRASALVRGEKETEVLVLEPVGRVVRGSEWRSA